MSRFLLPLIFLLFISCNQGDKQAAGVKQTSGDSLTIEKTISWIDDFKEFRTAAYQSDLKKVKTYFQFPIRDEGNDIWFNITDGEDEAGKFSSGRTVPITEKDFDKYYKKILHPEFIKGILKIKSEELYKTGHNETPEFGDGDISYRMYADFSKETNTLTLNLATTRPANNVGEEPEVFESNFIYKFKILPNGRLQFSDMAIAG